jgi:hypothetical protein
MKIATVIVRVLLGLMFVVFGSNFFLNFIPMPPPPPGLAGDYFKVFAASGYMYVVGALQLLSGLLLLIGRFVPFDHSRRDDLQHPSFSRFDGSRRSGNGNRRLRARTFPGLVISRSLRGDSPPLIST